MRRYCFLLQVHPDRLDTYRRRHAAVWPEMLAALRDTGCSGSSRPGVSGVTRLTPGQHELRDVSS